MDILVKLFVTQLFFKYGVAQEEIDCHGKAFQCMNTTHFLICVDLGNGVSTTVDINAIECPPPTVCLRDNIHECELPRQIIASLREKEYAALEKSVQIYNDSVLSNNIYAESHFLTDYDKLDENKNRNEMKADLTAIKTPLYKITRSDSGQVNAATVGKILKNNTYFVAKFERETSEAEIMTMTNLTDTANITTSESPVSPKKPHLGSILIREDFLLGAGNTYDNISSKSNLSENETVFFDWGSPVKTFPEAELNTTFFSEYHNNSEDKLFELSKRHSSDQNVNEMFLRNNTNTVQITTNELEANLFQINTYPGEVSISNKNKQTNTTLISNIKSKNSTSLGFNSLPFTVINPFGQDRQPLQPQIAEDNLSHAFVVTKNEPGIKTLNITGNISKHFIHTNDDKEKENIKLEKILQHNEGNNDLMNNNPLEHQIILSEFSYNKSNLSGFNITENKSFVSNPTSFRNKTSIVHIYHSSVDNNTLDSSILNDSALLHSKSEVFNSFLNMQYNEHVTSAINPNYVNNVNVASSLKYKDAPVNDTIVFIQDPKSLQTVVHNGKDDDTVVLHQNDYKNDTPNNYLISPPSNKPFQTRKKIADVAVISDKFKEFENVTETLDKPEKATKLSKSVNGFITKTTLDKVDLNRTDTNYSMTPSDNQRELNISLSSKTNYNPQETSNHQSVTNEIILKSNTSEINEGITYTEVDTKSKNIEFEKIYQFNKTNNSLVNNYTPEYNTDESKLSYNKSYSFVFNNNTFDNRTNYSDQTSGTNQRSFADSPSLIDYLFLHKSVLDPSILNNGSSLNKKKLVFNSNLNEQYIEYNTSVTNTPHVNTGNETSSLQYKDEPVSSSTVIVHDRISLKTVRDSGKEIGSFQLKQTDENEIVTRTVDLRENNSEWHTPVIQSSSEIKIERTNLNKTDSSSTVTVKVKQRELERSLEPNKAKNNLDGKNHSEIITDIDGIISNQTLLSNYDQSDQNLFSEIKGSNDTHYPDKSTNQVSDTQESLQYLNTYINSPNSNERIIYNNASEPKIYERSLFRNYSDKFVPNVSQQYNEVNFSETINIHAIRGNETLAEHLIDVFSSAQDIKRIQGTVKSETNRSILAHNKTEILISTENKNVDDVYNITRSTVEEIINLEYNSAPNFTGFFPPVNNTILKTENTDSNISFPPTTKDKSERSAKTLFGSINDTKLIKTSGTGSTNRTIFEAQYLGGRNRTTTTVGSTVTVYDKIDVSQVLQSNAANYLNPNNKDEYGSETDLSNNNITLHNQKELIRNGQTKQTHTYAVNIDQGLTNYSTYFEDAHKKNTNNYKASPFVKKENSIPGVNFFTSTKNDSKLENSSSSVSNDMSLHASRVTGSYVEKFLDVANFNLNYSLYINNSNADRPQQNLLPNQDYNVNLSLKNIAKKSLALKVTPHITKSNEFIVSVANKTSTERIFTRYNINNVNNNRTSGTNGTIQEIIKAFSPYKANITLKDTYEFEIGPKVSLQRDHPKKVSVFISPITTSRNSDKYRINMNPSSALIPNRIKQGHSNGNNLNTTGNLKSSKETVKNYTLRNTTLPKSHHGDDNSNVLPITEQKRKIIVPYAFKDSMTSRTSKAADVLLIGSNITAHSNANISKLVPNLNADVFQSTKYNTNTQNYKPKLHLFAINNSAVSPDFNNLTIFNATIDHTIYRNSYLTPPSYNSSNKNNSPRRADAKHDPPQIVAKNSHTHVNLNTIQTSESSLQSVTSTFLKFNRNNSLNQFKNKTEQFTHNLLLLTRSVDGAPPPKFSNMRINANIGNTGISLNNQQGYRLLQRPQIKSNQENNSSLNGSAFSCIGKVRGKYPDIYDNKKFYICIGLIKPITVRCPLGSLYDRRRSKCYILPVTTKCEHTCIKQGRFKDACFNNSYIICRVNSTGSLVRYKFKCPKNYGVSPFVTCVPNNKHLSHLGINSDQIRNTKARIVPAKILKTRGYSDNFTTIKLLNQSCSQFRCTNIGRYRNPCSPNSFYICKVNSTGTLLRYTIRCIRGYKLTQQSLKCEIDLNKLNKSRSNISEISLTAKTNYSKSILPGYFNLGSLFRDSKYDKAFEDKSSSESIERMRKNTNKHSAENTESRILYDKSNENKRWWEKRDRKNNSKNRTFKLVVESSEESDDRIKFLKNDKNEDYGQKRNTRTHFFCITEGRFRNPKNNQTYFQCDLKKHGIFRIRIKKCDDDKVFDTKKNQCDHVWKLPLHGIKILGTHNKHS